MDNSTIKRILEKERARLIFDDTIKSIRDNTELTLQLKEKFPQVVEATIERDDLYIYIARADGSRHPHELNVYNDADWNKRGSEFKPKLSWMSTQARPADIDYLNYLEVLGWVATEMKNFDNSEFFSLVASAATTKTQRDEERREVVIELDRIITEEKQEADLIKRDQVFEQLQHGVWFYKPCKLSSRRDRWREAEVIHVVKKNPKKIQCNYFKGNFFNLDKIAESKTYHKTHDDFWNMVKDYQPLTRQLVEQECQNLSIEMRMRYYKWSNYDDIELTFQVVTDKLIQDHIITKEINQYTADLLDKHYTNVFETEEK